MLRPLRPVLYSGEPINTVFSHGKIVTFPRQQMTDEKMVLAA